MVKRVSFAGNTIEFPDEFSREQIDQIIKERAPEYRKIFGIKEPEKPSGFKAAVGSGIDALQQQLYSAGEGAAGALGLESLAKFAGEGAARNKAEAAAALPEQMQFGKAESLGDYWRAAKEALGTSLPQMAPSVVAGALTGAAAGSAVPVLGTGIGALIGGTAAGLPQFFGANRERQKEENAGVVKSEGAALLAAVPQAAMDSLLGKFIPGAGRAVAGGVLTRAVKSGAEGVITEVPTEVGQSILERLQAGLPLDDDEAIGEYKEAAIAAGILGGGIGSVSGAAQKRAMTDQEMRALAGQEQSDQLQQNINDARMAAPAAAPAALPTAPAGTPPATTTAPATASATATTTTPATAPATGATAPNALAATPPAATPSAAPASSLVNQQAAETAAQIEAATAPEPAPTLPKGKPVRVTYLNDDGSDADVAQEMQLVGNEPDGTPILINPQGLPFKPEPNRVRIEPLEVTTPSPAQQVAQAEELPSATELTAEPAPEQEMDLSTALKELIDRADLKAAPAPVENAPAPEQTTGLLEDIKTLIENADLKAAPAPAENVPSTVQPETAAPASKRVRKSQAKPDTLTPEQEVVFEQAINSLPAGIRIINTTDLGRQLGFSATAMFKTLGRLAEEGKVQKTGKGPYMRVEASVAPAANEIIEAPAAQPTPQPATQAQPNIFDALVNLASTQARKMYPGEIISAEEFAEQRNITLEQAQEALGSNPFFKEEDGVFERLEKPQDDTPPAPAAKPKAAAPKKAPAQKAAPAAATEPKQKAARKPKATPEQLQAARDSIIAAPVKTKLDLPALMKQHDMTMEEVRGVARSLVDEGFVVLPSKSKGYIRTAKEAPKAAAPKVEAPKVEKVAEAPKVPSQEQAAPETKPVEQVVEKPVEPKAEVAPQPPAPAAEETEAETVTEKVDVADLLAALKKEAAAAPQLTDSEKLAMAGINKLSLKPDSVVSALTLMAKIREINPNSGLTAAKIKNEIFPELVKKGILVPGEKGTGNFLIPPKQKAAPKPRGPRTQESRRAGAERAAAKKNIDKAKTAAPVEEEVEAEEGASIREILNSQKDPDQRLETLTEDSALDLDIDDFIAEVEKIKNEKLAAAPKDDPFDASFLMDALGFMEDIDPADPEAVFEAQKLLVNAIGKTDNLLAPEVREDLQKAWAEGGEGDGTPGELTEDQKLKKRFDVLNEFGNKITLGNMGSFINSLNNEGLIDAKSKYWQDTLSQLYGIFSNEGKISALSYLENRFNQYRADLKSKPADKSMTPKQEAQKEIDNLHDNNQINTNSLLGLVDDFVKRGLFNEDIAKVVRSSIKSNAYQGSIVLERALSAKSIEELSTRGANALETEAEAEAKPKRTKRRKGKKKAAKEAKAAPELTPEQIAEREARRAEAQSFLNERLAKMEASGPFGQKAAAEVRRVLADGDISNVQAHHAFVMAEIATKLLKGTAANPDIRFLKSVDYDGRRLRRGNPDALAGLIEFSLNDAEGKSVLGYSRETAAHEPFHVLQDLMEQYDPATSKILFGQRTGIDPDTGHGIYKGGAFRDGMTLADISPSIQRTLKNLSPEPGGGSYWSRFSEQYNAQDAAGERLRSEFGKQREAMAYVFGMLADAKERGFNTNSLDPAFKRFVNFLAAFREKMGSFLRGEGYRSTDQVLEDYISGERQKGYGEEVDRGGLGEFSVRGNDPVFVRTYKELRESARSRSDWKDWYDRHDKLLRDTFGNDAELFQTILSATSQAASVAANVGLALKAYRQMKSNANQFEGFLPAVIKNLERIRADEALRGAKISEYGKASAGDEAGIAVDRHIAMIMFDKKSPNAREIAVAKEWIRDIARDLGWKPREVQAALWAANQVIQGKDPADVRSYDYFLDRKANQIAALRSAFPDVGREAGGIRESSKAVQSGEERSQRGGVGSDGEFSVRGGRLSEKAEMAINRGQLQNASKNLTIMQRLKKMAQRVFDPLADMTGRDEYLMQRYRALGNVSRLEKQAKAFYDAIHKATETQKKAIFSYLTTKGAIAPNLPPALQKAAVEVKKQINEIGENMVSRGMLSQESLDEYKDSYLPRLYMKYLLEGKNISTGLRVGSQEYLNQRKKLTVEERVALGEVEEPSFLAFTAMYRPQRDMAIMDFLSGIAQTGNDWVLPDTLIDWNGRKVTAYWLADEAHALRERMKYEPDPKKSKSMGKTAQRMQKLADPIMNGRIPENYKQLPKTSRYGALKGMTVRKEIYDDLVGAAQFNADASMVDNLFGDRNSALAKGTQFWKMTKTILNPPTQVRNFISNAVMLNLSGVSPLMVGPRMLQAMKEMRTNGPAWQIAKEYGVEATGFNEQEMREVNEALQEYLSKNTTGVMNVKVLANIFSKVSNKAGNWYQWSEQVFKTAKIIDELEKNKVYSMPKGSKARQNAEGAAALQAHKWFFDYSLVPPSIRSLRTMPFGAPFITYYYKALPVLAEVAMNPRTAFRFAPYVALATVLPAAIASSYDVEDEDIEKLRMSMSEQLRDKPNMLLIPWKDENGNWQFLDAGYFFPWTMFLTTATSIAKGDVSGALSSVGALSSPALSAVTAIKTNIDPFSGREIINKADPPHEQMMSLVHYVNNLISPPFLTQYGFAGKLYDNATNSGMNRYGEPNQDAAQITGRFFGFNFYPVVPEMQRGRNLVKMQADINDVKMRMRYTVKDLSLTDEQRRRAIEDYTAEILKRTEELVQYAKDSDIPGVLKKKQG